MLLSILTKSVPVTLLKDSLQKAIKIQQRRLLKMNDVPTNPATPVDTEVELPKLGIRAQTFDTVKPEQLLRDKQQQAAKRKAKSYIPGTVNLQVLGAGANGAPCSVYLFTDQSRYLFNCGEGTQRLAHEHKTKLARLEQIFVTRNTWPMVGGFPGLALTIQDAGVKELALHGPPQLDRILNSMKRFVVLKNLQVKTQDCSQESDFEDAVMSVKYVPLNRCDIQSSKPIFDTESPSTIKSDNMVIAYICTLKPRPGALNLQRCVDRGVPPGPLLGLLKNGKDITLSNGTVVKSKDVSEPAETALSFVFIDIPDENYLSALVAKADHFHKLQLDAERDVTLVIHFSPAHILENNCYQNFVQKFSANTQHIYLNAQTNQFSGYVAAHRIQYQLNLLNPRVFPLLHEACKQSNGSPNLSSKLKKTKLREEETEALVTNDVQQPVAINSLTNFHLRPRKGFDHSLAAKLQPSEYVNETRVLKEFPALLEQLQSDYKDLNVNARPDEYPKITFLGTGSCIPNKTRNVSAILVEPYEGIYILLDCGEGTLGQIQRFYGNSKAEEVVRNLRAIYVSHLHADHHIGLIALLNERQRLQEEITQNTNNSTTKDKVLLLAPKQIETWLDYYDQNIDCIANAYELIGNAEMLQTPLELEVNKENSQVATVSITTCLVRHCPHSFGVSLILNRRNGNEQQLEKPVKITYSGDTMPCLDLIELGHNSTILIHEATMEDDLIDEAKIKMHSTISQAIKQGRAMKAEYIVLTHFSQRYAKLPRMQSSNSSNINNNSTVEGETHSNALQNVAIAFDNMQITLSELQNFHIMYPALRALFAEHAEELEQKALKRELKLERKRKLLSTD